MHVTEAGKALVNTILTKNKEVKAKKLASAVSSTQHMAGEIVDDHFKYVKRGARSVFGGFGPGKAKTLLCFICGEHDNEMVSGIGRNDGAYYCREHKLIRGLSQQEQENQRSAYVGK